MTDSTSGYGTLPCRRTHVQRGVLPLQRPWDHPPAWCFPLLGRRMRAEMKASIGLRLTYKNMEVRTLFQETDGLVPLSFHGFSQARSQEQDRAHQQLSTKKPFFPREWGGGLEATMKENRSLQRESMTELGLEREKKNQKRRKGGNLAILFTGSFFFFFGCTTWHVGS